MILSLSALAVCNSDEAELTDVLFEVDVDTDRFRVLSATTADGQSLDLATIHWDEEGLREHLWDALASTTKERA